MKLENIFSALQNEPRLLIEAELEALPAGLFQPTGFPDLGHATYIRPDKNGKNGTVKMLLIESPQSVANRLEMACWNYENQDLFEPLNGLPYVDVDLGNEMKTNSIIESHRLNSIYISGDKDFRNELKSKIKLHTRSKPDISSLAKAVFECDPNSVIHGLFIARSDFFGGQARLQRLLSGSIEAVEYNRVDYGGVNNAFVDPTGVDAVARYSDLSGTDEEKKSNKKALETAKNIPYAKTEYVAESIKAYFNLDLVSMRGYRLGESANKLLFALSLYKILRFLKFGLKLRTRCDFECVKLSAKRPEGMSFDQESLLAELESVLPKLIADCEFKNPAITKITAPPADEKALEKAKKAMKNSDKDSSVDEEVEEQENE